MADVGKPVTPLLTVDGVVFDEYGQVLLVKRKNAPLGWALPGGFVDVGETVLEAVVREVMEETGVDLSEADLSLVGIFDRPDRDPRGHNVSIAFVATINHQQAVAGDDAADVIWAHNWREGPLVFDHAEIIGAARTLLDALDLQ